MSALNLYRSYNFVDKDPVIDLMRDIARASGGGRVRYSRISADSGVSEATLRNWFDGKTRRPQYATVAAVMGSLGYRQTWVLDAYAAEQPAQWFIEHARAEMGVVHYEEPTDAPAET